MRTRPYIQQPQSRAGGQGQYGSWAGTVTEICFLLALNAQKREVITDGRTDGPTEGQTDGWTNIVTYRVTCTQLKRQLMTMNDSCFLQLPS